MYVDFMNEEFSRDVGI